MDVDSPILEGHLNNIPTRISMLRPPDVAGLPSELGENQIILKHPLNQMTFEKHRQSLPNNINRLSMAQL